MHYCWFSLLMRKLFPKKQFFIYLIRKKSLVCWGLRSTHNLRCWHFGSWLFRSDQSPEQSWLLHLWNCTPNVNLLLWAFLLLTFEQLDFYHHHHLPYWNQDVTPRVKDGKVGSGHQAFSLLERRAEIFWNGDWFWKADISFIWQS